jgi:hypothetical protein
LQQFDADAAWGTWEDGQAKLYPRCAPKVAGIELSDFMGMHEADREAFRRRSEDAIRASTIAAVSQGLAVPAALLAIGLLLGWIVRGFRPS